MSGVSLFRCRAATSFLSIVRGSACNIEGTSRPTWRKPPFSHIHTSVAEKKITDEDAASSTKIDAIAMKRAYRDLLKVVKKHVASDERNIHFMDFIKQEFRTRSIPSSEISRNLKLARDYVFYLNSIHHHKELLFSYNIAVDRTDEMKRVLGKSAASVGLRLPEVYQP